MQYIAYRYYYSEREKVMENATTKYNPYDNVVSVVSNAASILGYQNSDYEAILHPER